MNAIHLLMNEHNKIRKILADITCSSHRHETKQGLFDKLCKDLLRHEKMEETVLYPQLKRNKKLFEEIKHLIQEEKSAEKAIKKLKHISTSDEWEKELKKFKEAVEHHASEEENNLFPNVEKLYEKTDLEKIGKEMLEFKREH